MNTNSKDVVKNVESNNVESTSNEQRQTVKPIIVSRRRLLRAGVAGIPVALTMAGIAPGQFGTQWSAASGLDYDGKHTLERFSSIHDDVLNDNLIYSDQDGFILKNNNDGYYEETCNSDADTITSQTPQATVTITFSGVTNDAPDITPARPPQESDISLSLALSEGAITYQARLNKNGNFYTQQSLFTSDSSKFTPTLTSPSYSSNYSITNISAGSGNVTIANLDNTDWPVVSDPWRQVPSDEENVSVTYTANTPFTYTTTESGNSSNTITYTGTINIEVTFPATVNAPTQTFEKVTDWN